MRTTAHRKFYYITIEQKQTHATQHCRARQVHARPDVRVLRSARARATIGSSQIALMKSEIIWRLQIDRGLHHKVQHHEFERQCQRNDPIIRVCCVRSPAPTTAALSPCRSTCSNQRTLIQCIVYDTGEILHSMLTTAVQILGGFFLQSRFPRLLHIRSESCKRKSGCPGIPGRSRRIPDLRDTRN